MSTGRRILLASGDLNARARVSQAAEDVGAEWESVSLDGITRKLAEETFDLLILDLDVNLDGALASLTSARSEGTVPGSVIGYYSHVDEDAAARARAEGVRPIRRGRFWTQLHSYISDG